METPLAVETGDASASMAPDARPLAISVGDPGGIGPSVAVRAVCEVGARACLFGDADRLAAMITDQGRMTVRRVDPGEPVDLGAREVAVVHVAAWQADVLTAHRPSAEGGALQLAALEAAAKMVAGGQARALVTGPTSKEAIELAGVPFSGQTEHLAAMAGLERDAVTMLFLGERLRLALATTHLAVADVPGALRVAHVARSCRHLAEALLALGIDRPRIRVTGLNPHAGESGLFGDEEIYVVGPGIQAAQAGSPFAEGRARLDGPAPAEAALRQAAAGEVDGVVTMMHDQATIASKLLDWGNAVNVTWGLPFVRTSVDHGVAYDAAARGLGDADGMRAALKMALRLTGDPP